MGDCEDNCTNVRDTGRCTHNDDNCDTIVQPRDGCCPICGERTAVRIAIFQEQRDTLAWVDELRGCAQAMQLEMNKEQHDYILQCYLGVQVAAKT